MKCIYSILFAFCVLFCKEISAQTAINIEFSGEIENVCNPLVSYEILDAQTSLLLDSFSVSTAPFPAVLNVPDGFCSVIITQKLTGEFCDTGEPCEIQTPPAPYVLPNCCTTVCLADGTEVIVSFAELTNWFTENALEVLIDWQNMPEYPAVLEISNFPEFPTSIEVSNFPEIVTVTGTVDANVDFSELTNFLGDLELDVNVTNESFEVTGTVTALVDFSVLLSAQSAQSAALIACQTAIKNTLSDLTVSVDNFPEPITEISVNNLPETYNIDWANMPEYLEPIEPLTFGESCENPIFTQNCEEQLLYNDSLILQKFDSLLVRQDSLISCLQEIKKDTCESYMVEKCVLCWGGEKLSNEVVTLPAKYNCCTGEYDFLDLQDELIFEGENQNAKIVKCDACFQHLYTSVDARFENITGVDYCSLDFDIYSDYPIDFEGFFYVDLIESTEGSMYIVDYCVKDIYKDGVLLTDEFHELIQYGDCCDCSDPVQSYDFKYFCDTETNTTIQAEYMAEDGVRIDTIYHLANGTQLESLPENVAFGVCCCVVAEPEPRCEFCETFAPVADTNTGRRYRRLQGRNWRIYSWQLNRMRAYLATLGATVNSEISGFYTDAGFTNLVLPITNFNPDLNPATTTINQHFNDVMFPLSQTPIYYKHELNITVDGCNYVVESQHRYDVATANNWEFVAAEYTCVASDAQSRKSFDDIATRQYNYIKDANFKPETKKEKTR